MDSAELAKQTQQSLIEARQLAAAALPDLVVQYVTLLRGSEDVEDLRKGIDVLMNRSDPVRKDEGRAGLRVFNITFGSTGVQATREPLEIVEQVERVEEQAAELVREVERLEAPAEDDALMQLLKEPLSA